MAHRPNPIILIDSLKDIRNGPTTVATGPNDAQFTDIDLYSADSEVVGEVIEDNNINQFTKAEINSIKFADSPNIDAFGRLRVSSPGALFDSSFTYQISTDEWDVYTSNGSITHNSTERWAALAITASASAKVILQSHYNPPYTPGRSHLAFLTFLFGSTPSMGVSRRVGLYSESSDYGMYLEQTSTEVNIVIKGGTSNGTQTVPQTEWNIDYMDGNGPSGVELDFTKVQILIINYQALYVGEVIFAFNVDGVIYPVHKFKHANEIAFPYIQNASLPVHYSVRNDASANTGTMKAICACVMNEGGQNLSDIQGRHFSASNGITPIGVTTRRPILSIRPAQQLNSINQKGLIIPHSVDIYATTNNAFIEIVRNGTLTGAAFVAVDATFSIATFDVAATAISGGTVIASFIIPAAANIRNLESEGLLGRVILTYGHLLGVADTLSVVATAFTGTSNLAGVLDWKEIR